MTETILLIFMIVSNAIFAAVLVVLRANQKRLTDFVIKDSQDIWKIIKLQIKINDDTDYELDENDNIHHNFAERLCDLENKMINIELDLEDKDDK